VPDETRGLCFARGCYLITSKDFVSPRSTSRGHRSYIHKSTRHTKYSDDHPCHSEMWFCANTSADTFHKTWSVWPWQETRAR